MSSLSIKIKYTNLAMIHYLALSSSASGFVSGVEMLNVYNGLN